MKTLFLDRDGVLNRDSGYTYIFDKSLIYDDVVDLKDFAVQNIFIVTNQSGIGRGYYSESDFFVFMEKMIAYFEKEIGFKITDFFYCPHNPNANSCECRKPLPGMLLDAKKRYGLKMSESVLIGDKMTDVNAGLAAGCGQNILIRRDPEFQEPLERKISFDNPTVNVSQVCSLRELSKWFDRKSDCHG